MYVFSTWIGKMTDNELFGENQGTYRILYTMFASKMVRISWLWHYLHYLYIPLYTIIWSKSFSRHSLYTLSVSPSVRQSVSHCNCNNQHRTTKTLLSCIAGCRIVFSKFFQSFFFFFFFCSNFIVSLIMNKNTSWPWYKKKLFFYVFQLKPIPNVGLCSIYGEARCIKPFKHTLSISLKLYTRVGGRNDS